MKRIEAEALRDLAGVGEPARTNAPGGGHDPTGTAAPLGLRLRPSRADQQSKRAEHPMFVVWPSSVEAVSRLVAYAHESEARVLAVGRGASLRLHHDALDPPEIEIEDPSATEQRTQLARTIGAGIAATGVAPDLVISTERLDRVLEHRPADLVARAECGIPFAGLQQALAREGQRAPLDPVFPLAPSGPFGATASTVGGVLATNAFGLRRLRSGTARDCVIGTRLVRFDGAIVQAGGRVVKNVSGYDLTKLYLGAMGAFGVLVDAFFKLEPIPRTRGYLVASGAPRDDRERSVGLVRKWLDEPWPLAWTLFVRGPDHPATLYAGFEGLSESVAPRGERAQDLAHAAGFGDVAWRCGSRIPMPELLSGGGSIERNDLPSSSSESIDPGPDSLDGGLVARVHHLPAEHLAFHRHARDEAPGAWPEAIEHTLLGAGISWLYWPAPVLRARPESVWREDLVHLRRAAVSLGGHLVLERIPRGWFADLPRLDIPVDQRRMMVRLLRALDPSGTFVPGMYPHELRGELK